MWRHLAFFVCAVAVVWGKRLVPTDQQQQRHRHKRKPQYDGPSYQSYETYAQTNRQPSASVGHAEAKKLSALIMPLSLGEVVDFGFLELEAALTTGGPIDELQLLATQLKFKLQLAQNQSAAKLAADLAECDTTVLAAQISALEDDLNNGDASVIANYYQTALNLESNVPSPRGNGNIPGLIADIETAQNTSRIRLAEFEARQLDIQAAIDTIEGIKNNLTSSSADALRNQNQIYLELRATTQAKMRTHRTSVAKQAFTVLHRLLSSAKKGELDAIFTLLYQMSRKLSESLQTERGEFAEEMSGHQITLKAAVKALHDEHEAIAQNRKDIATAMKAAWDAKLSAATLEVSRAATNNTLSAKRMDKQALDMICNKTAKYAAEEAAIRTDQIAALDQLLAEVEKLDDQLEGSGIATLVANISVMKFATVRMDYQSADAGKADWANLQSKLTNGLSIPSAKVQDGWISQAGNAYVFVRQADGGDMSSEEWASAVAAVANLGAAEVVAGLGNTCESNNGDCVNAWCRSVDNKPVCTCLSGYRLVDDACVNIDECSEDNECDEGAECTDTDGDYCCDGHEGQDCAVEPVDLEGCTEGTYSILDGSTRIWNQNYGSFTCDRAGMAGWYRLDNEDGYVMYAGTSATTHQNHEQHATTHAVGRIPYDWDQVYLERGLTSGPWTAVVDWITVAYSNWHSADVKVRNCGSFYSYYLTGYNGVCYLRHAVHPTPASVAAKLA